MMDGPLAVARQPARGKMMTAHFVGRAAMSARLEDRRAAVPGRSPFARARPAAPTIVRSAHTAADHDAMTTAGPSARAPHAAVTTDLNAHLAGDRGAMTIANPSARAPYAAVTTDPSAHLAADRGA